MHRKLRNAMNAAEALDAQVNQLAVLIRVADGPTALAPLQETSRFERMARELEFAIRHTSGADMTELMGHLASDGGSALVRRVTGLWDLAGKLLKGSASELEAMLRANSTDRLVEHFGKRVGTAAAITTTALSNGAKSLSSLVGEVMSNPSEAAPKLLVLVLSSVVASGGVDGNGGVPDLDIPLMGIGAHRSMLTHSIVIGSLLEAAVLLLSRIVLCTHKNLPVNHEPLWEAIARQSVGVLGAAGKGASFGIAYHLWVDSVVQPGAYHGVPFDMPMEAHQTIMGMNSFAEAVATKSYPDEEVITATSAVRAEHKKYRATRLPIPAVLRELLSAADVAILVRYGAWLQALAQRVIPPTTLAQVQFLKVVDGRVSPSSDHERAWLAFVDVKRQSGWTRTA